VLPFGAERLPLPEACGEWAWLDAPPIERRADRPFAGAAREAARRAAVDLGSRGRLALVVPDRTRPLPLPRMLPVLLRALAEEGIAPARLQVVPASGIHRPMPHDELASWLGPGAQGIAALPHDADAPGTALGMSASRIPVVAHPAVARADAVLAIGRIVFHYLAGFGGGRKMLVPGVAARNTILAVHSRCLSSAPGGGRHPLARAGTLTGNPVHEAACEAAHLFPPATLIHVELAEDGNLSAEAGDSFGDHARASARYAASHRVAADAAYDAVIVSAGGDPTDRDLVQAHKALDAVAPIVRDGGTVLLVAACLDGVGNRELTEGLSLGSPAAIDAALRRSFRVGLHTALALAEKTRRMRVLGLTALPDEVLSLARIERVTSLAEGVRTIVERHGSGVRAAIAPRGAALAYSLAGAPPLL